MTEPRTIDPQRIEILDEAVVEVLRRKTSAERVAMALDADRTWRQMLETYLRFRYPDWDDTQITKEIARR